MIPSRTLFTLAALALGGCGGRPFSVADLASDGGDPSDAIVSLATVDDDGSRPLQAIQLAPIDAGPEVSDAGHVQVMADASPDVAHVEAKPEGGMSPSPEAGAPSPEASPIEAAAPIEAGSCPSPWTILSPYCPAACGSGFCAGQDAPEYYFSVSLTLPNGPGCGGGGAHTPTACQACGSYTCACVLAHAGPCLDGSMPTCNGSTGMPTLICP